MKINFPVVVLSEDDDMCYVFLNKETFEITNVEGFERGVFNNLTIYDSEGYVHDSFSSELHGWGAPFWGYLTLRKGRQVRVKIHYNTRDVKISVEDIKEMVIKKIENSKGSIRQAYAAKMSIEDLKQFIHRSKTYKDIILTLK